MNERKSFQPLSAEENPQFLENGNRIYSELRAKYPHNTNEDFDNVLNALCAALCTLMHRHVSTEDHKQFLQLIHRILSGNL